MKRSHSSTSIAEIEREKKALADDRGIVDNSPTNRELYAVFELDDARKVGYYIYKLEQSRDVKEFQEPLYTLKLEDPHPLCMSIFSLGSKIYFCGGFWYNSGSPWANYSYKAYMFDVASKQGTPIQPMKYRKPNPLVLGPDDDSKFYVFSASRTIQSKVIERSFEILDTRSNTWESLDLPSSFETGVKSSVICGSNILLITDSRSLLVFSTKSKMWHAIVNDPFSDVERNFPQYSELQYVGVSKNVGHILLSYPSVNGNPELYSYTAKNDDLEDISPFMKLGEVEGFRDHFKPLSSFLGGFGWGSTRGLLYFDRDTFCLVRTEVPRYRGEVEQLVIDVFSISYSGLDDTDEKVKAKVKNFVQYQYVYKIPMVPKHFLAVG